MTHPLDLTVEEVRACEQRAVHLFATGDDAARYWSLFTDQINAANESKRLAERGNSPGIGGIPNERVGMFPLDDHSGGGS